MRGTVLLLDGHASRAMYAEHFRANGFVVYEAEHSEEALRYFDSLVPDVVIAVLGAHNGPSVISDLSARVDRAASIIVVSEIADCERARQAGADSFLLASEPPGGLVYEIRRALILRRSGRRLPWNRRDTTASQRPRP